MSLFNTVANIFRPVQATTNVGQPLAQQNPGAAAVTPPAGTSNPTVDTPPPNPLDDLQKLFQNDPTKQAPVDPLAAPLFNTDPAKVAAAAGKIDFLKNVPAELMTKAMAGNDPQAFLQVMNAVAQQTLATATQINTATLEQATQRNNSRLVNDVLPAKLKDHAINAHVPEHPALAHPAAQPFLQMVRQNIQLKNPGLSPAEINKQAEQALVGFAGQLATPAQEYGQKPQVPGTDWDTWIQSGPGANS